VAWAAWAAWTCDVRCLSNAQCTSEKGRSDAALFFCRRAVTPSNKGDASCPSGEKSDTFWQEPAANRRFLSCELGSRRRFRVSLRDFWLARPLHCRSISISLQEAT